MVAALVTGPSLALCGMVFLPSAANRRFIRVALMISGIFVALFATALAGYDLWQWQLNRSVDSFLARLSWLRAEVLLACASGTVLAAIALVRQAMAAPRLDRVSVFFVIASACVVLSPFASSYFMKEACLRSGGSWSLTLSRCER